MKNKGSLRCRGKREERKRTGSRKLARGAIGAAAGTAVVVFCFLLVQDPVYAADGAEKVTGAIDKIKNLMLGVVSGIGVIVAIKSLMDFSTAYSSQDNTGMNTALRGIVGGAIMAIGSGLLTWLGLA